MTDELLLQCRKSQAMVLTLCLIGVLLVSSAEAVVHNLTWEISYQYKYLDCYKKLSVAINGMTPGPEISAAEGDTIIVNVINNLLMENVAIHWHGIRQIGSQWSDGTDGVTQCATMPGDTFTYQFVVDKAGTYMYHSHYGMQREAGLYGMIKVSPRAGESEPFTYDGEHSIVLSDWYHSSPYEQATNLTSIPYQWIGEPQSLLINGRGKYDCANLDATVCNATNPECLRSNFTVSPGLTYRLRIASLTSLSALSFQIEGHNMTVVEADGNYVAPFATQNLYIYSGETYSVLITANQSSSRNYWITTNVVSRKPATPVGSAILNYIPNHSGDDPSTIPPPGPLWNDTESRKAQSASIKAEKDHIQSPPSTSDKTILLLNTQNTFQGRTVWSLNNVSHSLPDTPYLIALKKNWTDVFDQAPAPESYDQGYDIYSVANNTNAISSTSIYRLTFNSTVDVILQNANTMTKNDSETHPWHLHGHDFWVLGYGDDKFNLSTDGQKFNLVNPIMKNTVPLHPYGWTALRFRADNPGVWIFHCHIEPHFLLGMTVLFESGSEMVADPPQQNMGCGKTKSLIMQQPSSVSP
ncbi:L-ascorbate oxidase family protein [Melia azedarach]|uniref:L-ascorbate oxidase family protein n=1 Tax=Melia azedarach TaxID=155640 RepID=A0ACC1XY56_MELAZ|nr:L-ascorbate oxidase family protein [Melia azedarach]